MNADFTHTAAVSIDRPLEGFTGCHSDILSQLRSFAELPELVEAADRARRVAMSTMATFERAIVEHHADEERALFPAVVRSALRGEERTRVQAMVSRLTGEHRAIEALWSKLKPAIKLAAAGKPAEIDPHEGAELVRAYTHHAAFEELEFLPLAQEILGRNGNHMAALGLSLHLRHAPQPMGYI